MLFPPPSWSRCHNVGVIGAYFKGDLFVFLREIIYIYKVICSKEDASKLLPSFSGAKLSWEEQKWDKPGSLAQLDEMGDRRLE